MTDPAQMAESVKKSLVAALEGVEVRGKIAFFSSKNSQIFYFWQDIILFKYSYDATLYLLD